ncbi:MAG TPA: hypothetical protein VFG47_12775 [Geminicoccaceae bacterium]|nr:hypothetical protein [Geminicoccaceae bacterium]
MGGRPFGGHVVQRFPDRSRDIAALALASEDFRALCDDYGEAVEALRRWQASPVDPDAPARIAEFGQLVAELEDEILAELGRAGGWPCS